MWMRGKEQQRQRGGRGEEGEVIRKDDEDDYDCEDHEMMWGRYRIGRSLLLVQDHNFSLMEQL
jgi:hypothetical protein